MNTTNPSEELWCTFPEKSVHVSNKVVEYTMELHFPFDSGHPFIKDENDRFQKKAPHANMLFKPSALKILLDVANKHGVTDMQPMYAEYYSKGGPVTNIRNKDMIIGTPLLHGDMTPKEWDALKRQPYCMNTQGRSSDENTHKQQTELAKQIALDFIKAIETEMANNPFGGRKRHRTSKRSTRSRKHKKTRKH